jgi:two-component system, NarL family, nitrate/nitrite response regulator NarL
VSSDKVRILIIDDDQQFRTLVRLVLRRIDDFEVVGEAHDGHSGIEQTEELSPDVVLLDLMMPGMDGFQALPKIKAAQPSAAVVVLTALDSDQVEEAVLVGAASFVEKRHIADRLESVIRTHGQRPG